MGYKETPEGNITPAYTTQAGPNAPVYMSQDKEMPHPEFRDLESTEGSSTEVPTEQYVDDTPAPMPEDLRDITRRAREERDGAPIEYDPSARGAPLGHLARRGYFDR